VKDKKPVKWDKNGNAIVGAAKRKAKAVKIKIAEIAKANAANIVVGAVAGGASVGLALGLIQRVEFLRSMVTAGGAQRTATITGTALLVAGLGLGVAAKAMGPKRVAPAVPFVLGGTAILALAPTLAVQLVERIELWVGGGNAPSVLLPSTTGQGPVPLRMRARAARGALSPDEVRMMQDPPAPSRYRNNSRW